MKGLFLDWDSYGKEDIVAAFELLGHEITRVSLPLGDYLHDVSFAREFRSVVDAKKPDFVFSSNFYPVVSGVLRSKKIPYISWIYDSPLITLFSQAVKNPCNYIFIFDYQLYALLKERGMETVYYLPMAVYKERLGNYVPTKKQQEKYRAEIAFVGSLYDNKNNLFDRMVEKGLKERTRGYLYGLMEAQMKVFGKNYLEESITEEALQDMTETMEYLVPHGVDVTPAYVYANFFLGHKIATMERRRLLGRLSEQFDTRIYTTCRTEELKRLKNMGPVDYYKEMPAVFMETKINLNITLRSIQTGIPLRAMDILGCGGFLLTNYQEDFLRHFKRGVEFDYFESEEELLEKCEYYLSHEKERTEIAKNAREAVMKEHTMEKRLAFMLNVAMGETKV